MEKLNFNRIVEAIVKEDPRYDTEAYTFVREGLDQTLKNLKRSNPSGTSNHVTGQELLEGLKEHTIREFGPMGKTVLNEWGILECKDFGHIVFNLVNHGVLGKSDTDKLDDFKEIWSFDDAFVKPYLPKKDLPEIEDVDQNTAKPTRSIKPEKKTKSISKKNSSS
jgi:uncharacterized repeat protein (TIGR04138 family)